VEFLVVSSVDRVPDESDTVALVAILGIEVAHSQIHRPHSHAWCRRFQTCECIKRAELHKRRGRAPPSSMSMISATLGNMRSPLSTLEPPRKMSRHIRGVWMGNGPALLKMWEAYKATCSFWKPGATAPILTTRTCAVGLGSTSNQNCFRCSKSTLRWPCSSP